jgi:DNA polymerase III delta prime subunit
MLEHELACDRLPQTLLFYGPDGCGKFLTAVELVKVLNCAETRTSRCSCPSCTAIQNMVSPDLLILSKSSFTNTFLIWRDAGVEEKNRPAFVRDLKRVLIVIRGDQKFAKEYEALAAHVYDPESINGHVDEICEMVLGLASMLEGAIIGIDRIREVQRFLALKSTGGGYRAVIIDAAHRMNLEASNCFLKVSEDTPSGAIIVLTTTKVAGLKDTVRSRCRSYRFMALEKETRDEIYRHQFGRPVQDPAIPPGQAGAYLKKIAGTNGKLPLLTRIIDEIVEFGTALEFIDALIESLSGTIPVLGVQDELRMQEVQQLEVLLRSAEFTKSSILLYHTSVKTALTDFLLNNAGKIMRYVSWQ